MQKNIILKSCNPSIYSDEIVGCNVIENDEINAYLAKLPREKKFVGTKIAPVQAQRGVVGEVVNTTLYTERNGRMYILSEEDNVVQERDMGNGVVSPDIIVTNINSTSNERYVVKATKFPNMYTANSDGTFTPVPDLRELVQVDEDIIIKTAWGSEAVCLSGSYIVTYNAHENDFNTIEKGALNSTYSIENLPHKSL